MATGRSRAALVARVGLEGGDEFLRDLRELGIIGEKAFRDIDKAARDVKSLSPLAKRIKDLRRELELTSQKAAAIGQRLRAVGQSLTASLTAPIVAFGGLSLKAFSDFESGISNVGTLVDTTTESLSGMSAEILAIGDDIPVGIDDLTQALYDTRSAGIAAGDAMSVVRNSAILAVAGLGSTSEAVNLATSAIKAFNLEGEDQARLFDVIFTTVKNGKTTISGLAQGFGAVAGTVANAGVEVDEFLASVAALTTTGLPAAQAYTQLRAAIAGLTRETELGTEVLTKLGAKTFKDLIRQSGGLVPAFQRIVGALKGDDAALIKLLGSVEAYNAVIGLSGGLNEAFTTTLADMRDGVSNIDTAFETQREKIASVTQLIINDLKSIAIAIGEDLAPAYKQVAEVVDQAADAFRNLSPDARGLAENIALVAAAAGPVLLILAGLAFAISALLTPIGLAVGAVAALAVGVGAAAVYFEDFRGVLVAVVRWLGDVASTLTSLGGLFADWILGNETAATAAEQHKVAVDALKKSIGDIDAELPGAARNFLLLAEAQRTAALAAVEHARANLEFIRDQPQFAKIAFIYEEALAAAEQSLADLDVLIKQGLDKINGVEVPTEPVDDMAAALGRAGGNANAAADAVGGIGDEVDKTKKKVSDLEDKFKGLTALSRSLQTSVVDPSGGAGGEVIDTAAVEKQRADFGKLLAEIRSGAASTKPSVDALADSINDLGEAGATGDPAAAVEKVAPAVEKGRETLASLREDITATTAALAAVDFAPVRESGVSAFTAIGETATATLTSIQAGIAALGSGGGGTGDGEGEDGGGGGGGGAFQALATAATTAIETIKAQFGGLAETVAVVLQSIGEAINATFEAMRATVTSAFASTRVEISSIADQIRSIVESLIADMKRLQEAAKAALAAVKAAQSGGAPGFATGGRVHGPGTATSDSILARLSRGEFVVQARAVRHYGARLFEMLNAMRLPGFADGGFVQALGNSLQMPAIAAPNVSVEAAGGGLSGRPINLRLPDGRVYQMSAVEDVARRIERDMVRSEIAGGGKTLPWQSRRL